MFEYEPLGQRLALGVWRQRPERRHPLDDVLLASAHAFRIPIRIEPGRALWQRRQKRRLGRRQQRGAAAEVLAARALGAHQLIPVRRQIQIERENLALAQAMLEAKRDHRFVHLAGDATPARR